MSDLMELLGDPTDETVRKIADRVEVWHASAVMSEAAAKRETVKSVLRALRLHLIREALRVGQA